MAISGDKMLYGLELERANYWAWIVPATDGTIKPGFCRLLWVGNNENMAHAAGMKKVFGAPPCYLNQLRGAQIIEVDAGQAMRLIEHEAHGWADTLDDDRADDLVRIRRAARLVTAWVYHLQKTGGLGVGLQNKLPR